MSVSVIIPTMAVHSRSEQLKRAIKSIRLASCNTVAIIVVVNGARYDKDLCFWLSGQPDVSLHFLAEASAPKAIRRGVELVETEYYSCLDDDDEYINNAIDRRLALLASGKEIDAVISRGYRCIAGVDRPMYEHLSSVPIDPLSSLMKFNWLASCNFLFRKSSFDNDFFSDSHPFAEWTWLAFKLAMSDKRVAVLNDFSFRIHDTHESLSKSQEYVFSYISLFKRMIDQKPPVEINAILQEKLGSAYHDAADLALRSGDIKKSLVFHFKSILQKGGYKYLPFSCHYFIFK